MTEALIKFGEQFRIFVGLEELGLPMLALGACGMVNAVSNLPPHKVCALYQAVAKSDIAAARHLHRDLFELNRAVFYDTNPIPIKYMAKSILTENYHRLPMVPPNAEVAKRLDAVLVTSGLLQKEGM